MGARSMWKECGSSLTHGRTHWSKSHGVRKHQYEAWVYNMPCNNEPFNGIMEGKILEKHQVSLLFLVKRTSYCTNLVESIPDTLKAPKLPLYMRLGMYTEQVLCLRTFELRLELNRQVLKLFSFLGDRFLSIMVEKKPMLAGIVSSLHLIFDSFI